MKNIKELDRSEYEAVLITGVMKETFTGFDGPVRYIIAELFINNESIGKRRLDLFGNSAAIHDKRVQPGLHCKVEITGSGVLEKIIFEEN
ncbi:MAG: hypothetical protein LBH16_02805 [Treponema sp.]|jgi:hypothetical protein|nr:hypothetical protein [Treponema sp.]